MGEPSISSDLTNLGMDNLDIESDGGSSLQLNTEPTPGCSVVKSLEQFPNLTNNVNNSVEEIDLNSSPRNDESVFKKPDDVVDTAIRGTRNIQEHATESDTGHIEKNNGSNDQSREVSNPTDKKSFLDRDVNDESLTIERSSYNLALDETTSLFKRRKVELFAKDSGPQIYKVRGSIITSPIITANLPKVFEYLPICGKPQSKSKAHLEEFQNAKIRDFVGCDLDDEEFNELSNYCSPEQLRTGNELVMSTNYPTIGDVEANIDISSLDELPEVDPSSVNLCTLKKLRLRLEKDQGNNKQFKYRGIRMIPMTHEDEGSTKTKEALETEDEALEPGRDIVYRVRVYRPFLYSNMNDRITKIRHSVFSCDIIVLGRQKLSTLRDRIVCQNDLGMRIDISENPDDIPTTTAKDLFPSGFLFINNVFYVDTRDGCHDRSAPIREWASKRGLGEFPHKDMCSVRLDELTIKLGYPEVYLHQGNCEHLFTFSEIRLLSPTDPLMLSQYPRHTAMSQNQTIYCTTCGEYSAKYLVIGCERVPFDPAFFCDTCFKLYLYKDGRKIGDFKAYVYRGNELCMLKSCEKG